MADTFSDLTPEGKRYFAELQKLKKLEVRVGFQRGEKTEADGTDLVDIAAFNELGTSTIPARPFFKQSFENHEDELKKFCKAACDNIAKGGTAQQALNQIGNKCVGLVQEEIIDGNFVPNAPSTIMMKGSAVPLVDTGTMRENVGYVIKERGGKS